MTLKRRVKKIALIALAAGLLATPYFGYLALILAIAALYFYLYFSGENLKQPEKD